MYGLDIDQYWQNTLEPDTGAVALLNLVFKNFTGTDCTTPQVRVRDTNQTLGSVANGVKRPPLYLVANDLSFALNVTLQDIELWTESGSSVVNKIQNIYGKGDDVYGANDGLKTLPAAGAPTAYSSAYTITQAPSGWTTPAYPTWAVPTTGYGSKCENESWICFTR